MSSSFSHAETLGERKYRNLIFSPFLRGTLTKLWLISSCQCPILMLIHKFGSCWNWSLSQIPANFTIVSVVKVNSVWSYNFFFLGCVIWVTFRTLTWTPMSRNRISRRPKSKTGFMCTNSGFHRLSPTHLILLEWT